MGVNTQDLSDFKNDNVFDHNIESSMFVEEVSSTEIYVGYSKNSSVRSAPHWRIKRILFLSNVWNFQFPNGNQNFEFIWDDRDTYDYQS